MKLQMGKLFLGTLVHINSWIFINIYFKIYLMTQ